MDCGLRTTDCGLWTDDCRLRTADCGPRIADCGVQCAEKTEGGFVHNFILTKFQNKFLFFMSKYVFQIQLLLLLLLVKIPYTR